MLETGTKERGHALLDRMGPVQLSAVVGMMELLLDPVSRSIDAAPLEDEEISEEEEKAVAESKAWLAQHPGEGIPFEEILAEFGVNVQAFERLGTFSESHEADRERWVGR